MVPAPFNFNNLKILITIFDTIVLISEKIKSIMKSHLSSTRNMIMQLTYDWRKYEGPPTPDNRKIQPNFLMSIGKTVTNIIMQLLARYL